MLTLPEPSTESLLLEHLILGSPEPMTKIACSTEYSPLPTKVRQKYTRSSGGVYIPRKRAGGAKPKKVVPLSLNVSLDITYPKRSWVGHRYQILYADFPWPYTSFGTARLPYKSLSWDQIARFPWHHYMADQCVVFYWATGPYLIQQVFLLLYWMQRYNLRYLGMPYVWVKTRKDGKPIGAAGPRPTLVKPLDEFVLAFTNVKRGRPFPLLTEAQNQNVFAPKPKRGEHSRKPAEVRRRIVELLGDRPRLELFARDNPEGWDVLGDETPNNPQRIDLSA